MEEMAFDVKTLNSKTDAFEILIGKLRNSIKVAKTDYRNSYN